MNNTHKLVQLRNTVHDAIILLNKVEQRHREVNNGMAAPVDVRIIHIREMLEAKLISTVPELLSVKEDSFSVTGKFPG